MNKKENKKEFDVLSHKDLKREWESYKCKAMLQKKEPVIVKVGMVSFKNFTKGFQSPVDPVFTSAMNNTMKEMCSRLQGCVFAYGTRNEMEFILTDYHKLNSDAWLNYDVQKIASQLASDITLVFNKKFEEAKEEFYDTYNGDGKHTLYTTYNRASESGAIFSVRSFNVPEERIVDMIYYRQRESVRNFVQLYGKTFLSKSGLIGKTMKDIREMLLDNNVDLRDVPKIYEVGVACKKGPNTFTTDRKWTLDEDTHVSL